MVKKITVIFAFFLILILPKSVLAAGEFTTSYDVLYDIGEDGLTTVTEKITLKNLTSESYASKFKLTIGATQISDIKASDPGGALAVTSEQKGAQTTIGVQFNQQVAGMGKTLPWTLSFRSKDFAEKLGLIWEIRIPKISSSQDLQSYNVTVSVPQSFGPVSLITPTPKSQTSSSGKTFLTFDMNQLKTSGISATFGTHQLFDFDLSYHLENKNLMPILTNIALPPDTPYQDVIYQRIDPAPLNVTVDNDGNYLAWYRLNRNQRLDIKVYGSVKLYTASKVRNPVLNETLRKKYTSADKYWEKDNPQIVNKLQEILSEDPVTDSAQKAKLIFDFVVSYLKYDSGRLKGNLERLGAVTVLNNPESAVCMEFTDLFIALARAAGIPARELNGYAYTSNTTLRPLSLGQDILHAWPEYWDEKRGWVMVDPTWENTTGGADYFSKLDLNHFTFAIKGFSSSAPVPAGSYKYATNDSKDVKVTLSDTDFLGKPQINIAISAADPVWSGFPGKVKIKITNTGNAVYPSNPLTITASKLAILGAEGQSTGLIPPFGSAEFEYDLRTKSLFESYSDQILVLTAGQEFTKDVKVMPFVLFQTVPMMAGGVAGLMIVIYLAILGTLIYKKRLAKRK